ncbi:hypothetical protein WJ96_05350 [Burkholderia ubonensis]|uniref:Uncharacterized protein n=1 Tax=Burkholderia ubonensis TaxID=101571 RepID=A0AAW3MVM4_9BURK|nr:hypothetical protein [Burkholderia ubonensis]KVP97998.1 hypothetical protein WJ96_05350 [Burkholderia ubonensis]KVZ92696.1 hypothetical protein WL25_17010 [Burkholderia ubonensis]
MTLTRAELINCINSVAALASDGEVFEYFGVEVDISAIRDDIASGRLKPAKSVFDREFIEAFATQVQGLRKDAPESKGISLLTGVRAADVHQVPDVAYEQPLILAHMGRNKGVINLGDGTHYVLVDGNKRLGKAFFTGREKLDVVILSQAQSRKYKLAVTRTRRLTSATARAHERASNS